MSTHRRGLYSAVADARDIAGDDASSILSVFLVHDFVEEHGSGDVSHLEHGACLRSQRRVNSMKRRLFVPIVFAGVALASGVASANPQYWRDNGLLLEVSADPRDGRDFVAVDATRADRLELIALNDTVTLRGITLRFADGRAISQRLGAVHPGQPVLVDLPPRSGAITGVELDYGNPAHRRYDRTPARLQIVPHGTRHHASYASHLDHHAYTDHHVYTPPQPVYRPAPAYTVQPRRHVRPRRVMQNGWTIQGSFRF